MESYIIDKNGNCRNKYKTTKKFGKVELYPLIDTMNKGKIALFTNESIEFELNNITNRYVQEVQKNDKLIAILRDIGIDEDFYWQEKNINDSEGKTNIPVHFNIYDNVDFAIKEMVCTLKNIGGEYTYCKGRLRKIYSQILKYLTNGGITVMATGVQGDYRCKLKFSKEYEKYNVPKNWEKNPLDVHTTFNPKVHSKVIRNRKNLSGKTRQNVLMRDKYTCQICGKTVKDGVKLHLDHIVPVSKGGSNEENNLQVLCDQCNLEKNNRTDLDHDKKKLKELRGDIEKC